MTRRFGPLQDLVHILSHLLIGPLTIRLNICPCLFGAVVPGDFVVLAITDAHVGAGPLGYVIAVTDDNVVIVHCTPDDTERDYDGSSLQQYIVARLQKAHASRRPGTSSKYASQVRTWLCGLRPKTALVLHRGCGYLSTSFLGIFL